MLGMMQKHQLLISSILTYAETAYPEQSIVSLEQDGSEHHVRFADFARRTRQLANALRAMGVQPGDVVGTLAWSSSRHMELYFAITGIGAVCNTINFRLFKTQLVHILDTGGARVVFVDADLLDGTLEALAEAPGVHTVVWMAPAGAAPREPAPIPGKTVLDYEDLLAGSSDDLAWPEFDEDSASLMCFTSGTSGAPKGVVYSHRAIVLQCLSISGRNALDIGSDDVMMPVVPLFHVNGWGHPFVAAMNGAKLVLNGRDSGGATLARLIRTHGVTTAAGVPTIWKALEQHLQETGETLPTLGSIRCGGSACSRQMIDYFSRVHDVALSQGWGMTETASTFTLTMRKTDKAMQGALDEAIVPDLHGRPVFGCDLRIVDEAGAPLPNDGEVTGDLQIRGHWVASGYLGSDETPMSPDGWFRTGDVARVFPNGYIQIVDRKKDLIKSGGEWISSQELEYHVQNMAGVKSASVIAIPDSKWGERPLLVVCNAGEGGPDAAQIRDELSRKVAKWWIPERIEFRSELPTTASGKVQKNILREEYADG